MRILQEVNSQRFFAIQIGQGGNSSLIFIPSDKDPDERVVELQISDPIGVVPQIYKIKISLIGWLKLTEDMYQGLKKAGWRAKEARQILPRGGQNGSI